MNNVCFLHALLFDGTGGAKNLTARQFENWDADSGVLWLHFDYSSNEAASWIRNQSSLDLVSIEFLLTEDTRPRITSIKNHLLIALRGVNLNPHSDPEDMIGIRVFASETMIITTVRRKLLSIDDILTAFECGDGPLNSSEFIVDLARRLISRMGPTIDNLEEMLADIEEQIIDTADSSTRRKLSDIRRESIALRKHLAPQREAMYRFYDEKIRWLTEQDRIHSREVTDYLLRYIENLDTIRERATIIHEELASNLSEQINSRMYVLSLITTIFLPLGFLTGLLGVNVGGIPGADNKLAFTYFLIILAVIALILLILFKRKRWM